MTLADSDYTGKRKQTRKYFFLIKINRVISSEGLITLIYSHNPKGEGGCSAYPLMAMLRVHLTHNWFGYSDPAMGKVLYETAILLQLSGLNPKRILDAPIFNFCRLLERYELAAGLLLVINGYLGDRRLYVRQVTIIDATLIKASSSTKKRAVSATPNAPAQVEPTILLRHEGLYRRGRRVRSGAQRGGAAAYVADVTRMDKL